MFSVFLAFLTFARRQYALLAIIPFILGIHAAAYASDGRLFPVALLFLSVLFFAVGWVKKIYPVRFLFWIFFFPAGYCLTLWTFSGASRNGWEVLYAEQESVVEGGVASEPFVRKKALIFELNRLTIQGRKYHGRLLVRGRDMTGKNLSYGEIVRLTGRIEEPDGMRNPGGFDYRKYLLGQGVYGMLSFKGDAVLVPIGKTSGGIMGGVIVPFRQFIRRTVDRYVGDKGYLVIGLLLGERRDLPEETALEFRNTGLMHILAVSGLNVAMLILIFFQVFAALFLPRQWRILFTLLAVWIYALLTGMTPSVVRASVMGSVLLMGMLFERTPFILNSIALSALLLLLYNPLYLYDPGFLLSYSATLGLVYGYSRLKTFFPWLDKLHVIPKNLLESILISAAASLFTLPVLAFYFNQIAWISLLANLAAVPLSFALLGLGLLLIFSAGWPLLAGAYGTAAYYITELIGQSVSYFARIPGGYVECVSPSGMTLLFYFILTLFLLELRGNRWARRGLLLTLLLWIGWRGLSPFFLSRPDVRVTFLDVGQGDAILLEYKDGRTVLVDGGKSDGRMDAGDKVVVPCLRKKGIDRVDLCVMTHPDNDHLGGLLSVIRKLEIGTLLEPPLQGDTSGLVKMYETLSKEKPVPRITAQAGMRFSINDSTWLDVLHPRSDTLLPDANNNSVVIRAVCGAQSILLTGDLEEPGERVVLSGLDSLPITFLKVGHHGSRASTGDLFLEKIHPKYAVIQVGRWNTYHHPNDETLKRLRGHRVHYYRTDFQGAIVLELNRGRYHIQSLRDKWDAE